MARNVEIKARLSHAGLASIRTRAIALSDRAPVSLSQVDTFFNVPRGRLKLREFEDGSAELIAYERRDQPGPTLSSYTRHACADPASLLEALARTVGIRGVVEKRRQVIMVGQTRVHLDEVRGLGEFMELEVVLREDQDVPEGERIASELMASLGVSCAALVHAAYIDLLERNQDGFTAGVDGE